MGNFHVLAVVSVVLFETVCCVPKCFSLDLRDDGYHVFPGDNIQDAIQQAARNQTNKTVKVHPGQYAPKSKRQALIWFNRSHDGIHLEALGSVVLSAANPELTSPQSPGFPAVVNHVVYFGEGISSNTVLKGFHITGANHFVSDKLTRQMEPDTTVAKNLYFYTDGGAIKIFGHSYPTIQNVEVVDNYSSPCGAGISVQHEGFNQNTVVIENCVFMRNRAQVTGAAIDLLQGSAARIRNCLFVGNVSNAGMDIVALRSGEPPFTNSGVVTVFEKSRAWVENCTFTGNRNGVDDLGGISTYTNCIFVDDTLAEGLAGTTRYELDLRAGGTVDGCMIKGVVIDPSHCISSTQNQVNPPQPGFSPGFAPTANEYLGKGYRPVVERK
jgi:hypothetical protein